MTPTDAPLPPALTMDLRPGHVVDAAALTDMLALQAGSAPMGIRGIVVAAITDPTARPDQLRWLARTVSDYAVKLAKSGAIDRAAATQCAAGMLAIRAGVPDTLPEGIAA